MKTSVEITDMAHDILAYAKERAYDLTDDEQIAKLINDYSLRHNLTQTEEDKLAAIFIGLTYTDWKHEDLGDNNAA